MILQGLPYQSYIFVRWQEYDHLYFTWNGQVHYTINNYFPWFDIISFKNLNDVALAIPLYLQYLIWIMK